MKLVQVGNISGQIFQTERPVHINPDGSAIAQLTYKCSTAVNIPIPQHLSAHPSLTGMECYEVETDLEPGGVVRVTAIYRGVLVTDGNLAQHEFQRTVSEAPIETHPLFSQPADNPPVTAEELNKIEIALQNNTPFKGGNSAAVTLYKKKRRGIESYLRAGAIYRKSYASSSYPSSAEINNVGKIDSPGSPCPSAPEGQDYIYMGCSFQKQAGVVTITKEWQLSGIGGWDKDLYS